MPSTNTSFSSCEFFGSLGDNPTLRYTSDGKPVANLSMAVNSTRYDADDQPVTTTCWARVTVFGDKARQVEEIGRKGAKLYIRGRIKPTSWTDSDGVKRTGVEFVVEDYPQDYVGAVPPADSTLPKLNRPKA